jgi:hypothetical protein
MNQRKRSQVCAAPNCKVRFTPPTKRRIYCSPRCKKRAQYERQHPKTRQTRTCASPGCEHTFEPLRPNNVYCSQACQEAVAMGRRWARRQADYHWKVPRTCARPGCGVVFTPSQERVICCSTKCRDWRYHGTTDPQERTCARPGCGRTFRSSRANRLYCSRDCGRLADQAKNPWRSRFQRMIDKRVEARLKLTAAAGNGTAPRKRGRKPGSAETTQHRIELAAAFSKLSWTQKAMAPFVYRDTPGTDYVNTRNLFADFRAKIHGAAQAMTPAQAELLIKQTRLRPR